MPFRFTILFFSFIFLAPTCGQNITVPCTSFTATPDSLFNEFLHSPRSFDSLPDVSPFPRYLRKIKLPTRSPGLFAEAAMCFIEDTTSLLFYRVHDGAWTFLDTISTNDYFFGWMSDHYRFDIDDYNGDGLPDLCIYVGTNINGNLWSSVYLNKGDGVWAVSHWARNLANPSYNREKQQLECVTMAGAYGTDVEELFKWEGWELLPSKKLERHHGSMMSSRKAWVYFELYDGKNGEWRKIKAFRVPSAREDRMYQKYQLIEW